MFYDLNLPYPTQPNMAQQQTELRKRDARVRIISRRFWHTRRNVRSSHAHADRESACHSRRVARSAGWDLLGNLDEICHRAPA